MPRAGDSPGALGFVEAGRARRANTALGNSRASSASLFITMMFILFRARSVAARGGGDRVVESSFLTQGLLVQGCSAKLKWLLARVSLPALSSISGGGAGVMHPEIPLGSGLEAGGGVFTSGFAR